MPISPGAGLLRYFQTRGIATRLWLGFGLMIALLVGVAGFGVAQLHRMQVQAEALVEEHIGLLDAVGQLQDVAGQREAMLRELGAASSQEDQAGAVHKLQVNTIAYDGVARRFASIATGERAREGVRVILDLGRAISALEAPALELQDQQVDPAKRQQALTALPKYRELHGLLRARFSATRADADASVAQARQQFDLVVGTIVAIAGVAILLGAAIAFFTTRGVVRPLHAAREAALQVAQGDLTHEIETHGNDETAQLVGALEWMRMSLADAVGDIRRAAIGVRAGAQSIEQGNASLAARTEDQASSLEETASSLEQLTATVQQNAQGAGEANRLAGQTSAVASRGGEAVRAVVNTMQGIQAASRRIADITSVIDGIAFQTNILALNAAVEAARAGDQGRGFAVVAAEVRSLAQRSAQAAKEIKGLIEDSTSRVAGGVREVESAGRTMDEIVGSVQQVNALIAEIAQASAEQLGGIQQVNQAIAQMEGHTQQNASMVDQAAAAAEHLAGQADLLVQTVAKFKVEHAPDELAAPSPLPSGEQRHVAAGGGGVDRHRLLGAEPVQVMGPPGLGAGA
ncbi:MAG: methyl-accepting chemotaxis protein [Ramlibacter sp.]